MNVLYIIYLIIQTFVPKDNEKKLYLNDERGFLQTLHCMMIEESQQFIRAVL